MRLLLSVYISLSASVLIAQLGGVGTYEFLNLSQSARLTALGGYGSMLRDDDVNLGMANPAALNQKTSNQVTFNHNFHIADISYGHFAYGFNSDSLDIQFSLGAQYVSYGEFLRTDVKDQISGSFGAAEYAVYLSASKLIASKLSIGTTFKLVRSDLDQFNAMGFALDVGLQYLKPENRSRWSLVFRNIGQQFNQFDDQRESLPFDIQIGYVKRLEYLPFKFLVTFRDLQRWDIGQSTRIEDDPIFINQATSGESGLAIFSDNLFRHLVFGGEFIVGQKETVRLRFGYNHQRNQELKSSVFRSFGGFSFGIGIRMKRFRFDYGLGNYHLSGGVSHLSVTLDISSDGPLF